MANHKIKKNVNELANKLVLLQKHSRYKRNSLFIIRKQMYTVRERAVHKVTNCFTSGYIEKELKKDKLKIPDSDSNPKAPAPKEMVDLEVRKLVLKDSQN